MIQDLLIQIKNVLEQKNALTMLGLHVGHQFSKLFAWSRLSIQITQCKLLIIFV